MKHGLMTTAAAAVLAGTMVFGCDSKAKQENADAAKPSRSTVTPPPTTQAGGTLPMTMKGAASNASDTISADAQKMKDKINATSAPALPGLPPMK